MGEYFSLASFSPRPAVLLALTDEWTKSKIAVSTLNLNCVVFRLFEGASSLRMKEFAMNGLNPLAAFGAGLAMMYFMDPAQGRRRRAVTRDKIFSAMRVSACAARKSGED